MDYNNYNYNRDYNNRRKPQKRVQSVQDMMNTSPNAGGYNNSARSRARSKTGSYEAAQYSGGIGSIAGVIYVALLCICLLVSILAYRSSNNKAAYHYPLNVVTMNGVLTDIYEAKAGGAGGSFAGETDTALPGDLGGTLPSGDVSADSASASAMPVTPATGISGAAMLLDVGGGVDGYTEATSYSELISQLQDALASGDTNFIGSKIGYTDDATGSILGFPQSVVEHFASFMAANSDKRETFIASVQDADKFSGMSGTAYVVNLPLIKYKVTTDYDDTSFTFSGFSEQTINANQEATVSPMLPCMYTVTATCPAWAQPIEGQLEATLGENLEVNFGTN